MYSPWKIYSLRLYHNKLNYVNRNRILREKNFKSTERTQPLWAYIWEFKKSFVMSTTVCQCLLIIITGNCEICIFNWMFRLHLKCTGFGWFTSSNLALRSVIWPYCCHHQVFLFEIRIPGFSYSRPKAARSSDLGADITCTRPLCGPWERKAGC